MLRSLTAVTSPYFLVMWSSVTPAIDRFSFPPSLGRCKGVLKLTSRRGEHEQHSTSAPNASLVHRERRRLGTPAAASARRRCPARHGTGTPAAGSARPPLLGTAR